MAIAIVAALLAGYIVVRIILRTGGALARLLSRGLTAARRTWRRADWLGRLTQVTGWLLLAGLVLVPAGDPGSTWRLGHNITLTVLSAGLMAGATALLVPRIFRRIHRPRDDERAWQARELLYADADREGHDVLLVDSVQYRVGVGQRCWTVQEATGEIEDTWFASQHIPVGGLVLADRTPHGARRALTWLTPAQIAGAGRHEQRIEREAWREARRGSDGVHGWASPGKEPVVAEAEAILRRDAPPA